MWRKLYNFVIVYGGIKLNILFCLNDKYSSKLAVALSSLLDQNVTHMRDLVVYVRSCDLSDESKNGIYQVALKYNFPCDQIIFTDASSVEKKLADKSLAAFKKNYIAYYKIFDLDKITSDKRILVIDCDTLVVGDIEDLYKTEMGSCPIGAVKEFPTKLNKHGTDESQEYNTGVLLVNLELYKKYDIQNVLLNYVQEMPEDWYTGDQALISLALSKEGYIFRLPLKYNFIISQMAFDSKPYFKIYNIGGGGYYSREEFEQAQSAPTILHLISGNFVISPWFDMASEPVKSLWRSYIKGTIWEKTYLEKLSYMQKLVVIGVRVFRKLLPSKVVTEILSKMYNK